MLISNAGQSKPTDGPLLVSFIEAFGHCGALWMTGSIFRRRKRSASVFSCEHNSMASIESIISIARINTFNAVHSRENCP